MGTIRFKASEEQNASQQDMQNESFAEENLENNIQENVISNGKEEDKQEIVLSEKTHEKMPEILFEDLAKRENNVKHFRMSDGTYQAQIFNEPIHYYDDREGKFIEIDNTLCECAECSDDEEDFDGFENKNSDVKVKFGKTSNNKKLFTVTKGEYRVEFRLLGKKTGRGLIDLKENAAIVEKSDNQQKKLRARIRYNDIAENTDLEYIVSSSKIKENIIVKDRQEDYQYDFELKLKNLNVELSESEQNLNLFINRMDEESGEISKETIFTIPMPYMYDASNVESHDVTYELEHAGGDKFIFSIIANSEWINAEDRAFPVVIDPVIITNNSAYVVSKTIFDDNYVVENDDIMQAGYFWGTGQRYYCASFISVDLPSAIMQSKISSVALSMEILQENYYGDLKKGFYIKKINAPWKNSLNWNQTYNLGEVIEDFPQERAKKGKVLLDVTKAVLSKNNYGVAIVSNNVPPLEPGNQAKNNNIKFVSSTADDDGKLRLIVNYAPINSIVSNKQQKNSVNRAGTGVLDLYTKNLQFVHNDVSLYGEKMPLEISHIYNSKFAANKYVSASNGKATGDLCMGRGWKTNLHQYLFHYDSVGNISDDGHVTKYVYIDQYGNENILVRSKQSNSKYEIIDDNGRGLVFDESSRVLSDKSGTKLKFSTAMKLVEIEDKFGVLTKIAYSGDMITSVRDGSGRYAYFNYIGSSTTSGYSLLSSISYANSVIRFTYDGSGRLTQITYPDNTFSQYTYGESWNSYYLTSIRDQTGYKLQYVYGLDRVTIRESTNVSNIKYNTVTNCAEKYGNQLEINYVGNKTYIKTKDGKYLVHIFNNNGIAYCSYIDGSNTDAENHIHVANNIEYSSMNNNSMFAVSSTKDLTNYINNGSFESYASCWIQGTDNGYCDCVTTAASAEGNKSFRLGGEINKIKYLMQNVVVPPDSHSFMFSAFAKANSLVLNDKTRFRISAQIMYRDGSWEAESVSDFNYLETEWQLAAVGVSKSPLNRNKSILHVKIMAEYSNNLGDVFFDNFRLTQGKFVKQSIENNYYVNRNGVNYPIEDITAVQYTTEGFLAIRDNVVVDTYQNGKFILKYEDIDSMIKQKIAGSKGFVVVNNEVKTTEAIVGEEFWGSSIARIEFVINGIAYDIFDFAIKNTQTIEIENGTNQLARMLTDLDGNVVKSTIIDEYGKEFTTDYTYDRGKPKSQTDYRRIQTDNEYDGYGNLVRTSVRSKNDANVTNSFIQQFSYANSGNTMHRSYNERGSEFSTTTMFDNALGTLSYMTMPNGQKINYNYYADNSLNSMSTTVQTEEISNRYDYTRGLLTKLVSENNTYLFEYDGFGSLIKTIVNGQSFLETEYKTDSDYTSTNESTFNYSQVKYNNGIDSDGKNKTYREKSFYNKNEALVSTKAISYNDSNVETTEELVRCEYDGCDRLNKLYDRGLGQSKQITYQNYYKGDGKLDYVGISGYHSGSLKENYDRQERLTSKNITFGEQKNYAYYYEKTGSSTYVDNRVSEINIPTSAKISYAYDNLSRIKGRTIDTNQYCRYIKENYSYLKSNYDPYTCRNDRTTNFVSMVSYSGCNFSSNASYTYDKLGNISKVSEGGREISYEYDGISRLTRENNQLLGTTKLFEYDANGNIIRIKRYNYSINWDLNSLTNEVITTFTYSGGVHKDRLEGVKTVVTNTGEILENYVINSYDNIGNPCNYKGNVLKWNRGRNLAEYGGHKYLYNASGIRQEKLTADGTLHKYFLEGNRIHKETRGSSTLWYYYDQTGITGVEYNTARYYFQKNIQGDVVRIFDSNANLVASYVYDAWGNHKVLNPNGYENTSSTFIGNINPFRYRGYYYDQETKLYYLNSRYYDPQIGRFINADDVRVTGVYSQTLNGLNLYSYCLNNPVMHTDESGHAISILGWLLIGLGALLTVNGIIHAIANYQRDPTGYNLFMLILEIGLALLDIALIVVAYVKYARQLKLATNYIKTDAITDGAESGVRAVTKNADEIVEVTQKPMQVHHFLTNKNKKYTPKFEAITNKYGLDLDAAWNKQLMPHRGRHASKYHDFMLDNIVRIDQLASGNGDIFLREFDILKQYIMNNPIKLTKAGW